MKIGIDIDGVILDFESLMNAYAEMYDLLILKKSGVVKKEEFSYLNKYDWTLEEKEEFINKYLIKGTLNCNLIPLAKEVIDILIINNDIKLITARGLLNKKTKKYVLDVLKKYDIKYNGIYFETKNKVEMCKKLNIDIMIEDNPNIAIDLANNNIMCLYLKSNNNPALKESKYLIEVNNWGEILRYIINKTDNNNLKTYKEYIEV